MTTMISTEEILGYSVMKCSPARCVQEIVHRINMGEKRLWLSTINANSYEVATRDPAFSTALRNSDWIIPDGVGFVFASRWLAGGIRERVTGSDIFQGVHEYLDHVGSRSVFFLGSTEETLGLIRSRMAADFPHVRVAGTYSPPFKAAFSKIDNDRMISAINEAAPDVLWVGMTAPKQELWIDENLQRLDVKLAAAVGAVFDFYSGQIKRPHPIFQRHGLEWLARFVREPWRLRKRVFISYPFFVWHVTRAKLTRNRRIVTQRRKLRQV